MQVIYEDNHLIAVNKTCSEIVQGDKTGDTPLSETLKAWLKEKYNKPGNVFVGVIHRLDRPVSGVVLFAKTSKALERLNAMFRNGEIKKTYWAVVKNPPPSPEGELIHWLTRNEKLNKSFVTDVATVKPNAKSNHTKANVKPNNKANVKSDAKQAILRYRLIARSERYHLLEIDLQTGRHHQIRVQLSHIGCPVKGDLKYGADRSNPDGGISLHAHTVSFLHPVTHQPLTITAPPPSINPWNTMNNE